MKKLLYVVIGIAVIYLTLCLFGPSAIKVERAVNINASKELVQKQLKDLKYFHDVWSPWTELDPNMKTSYAGETGEVGSSYSWESEKDDVGKGTMTYSKSAGDSIHMTLMFEGMGTSYVYYITKDSAGSVNVTWGMTFDIGFFGRGPMLFMNFDKQMGPQFEGGLAKLKTSIESMASMPKEANDNYDIKEVQWEAKTYYGKKETLSFDKMEEFFSTNYPALGEALGKAKAQPIGMPKAIYYSFDEEKMISECAAVMEVSNDTKVEGFEKFESPASKVLHIEYYGAYEKSANAHYAMDNYIKANGSTPGLVLEEYVTDPMTEKDTTKWLTNIYYLVQ